MRVSIAVPRIATESDGDLKDIVLANSLVQEDIDENLRALYKLVDENISLVDTYIDSLLQKRDLLLKKRLSLLSQLDARDAQLNLVGQLPVEELSQFLTCRDFCRFSMTSKMYYARCYAGGKLPVSHLTLPKADMDLVSVEGLLTRIALGAVQSLTIDAKRRGSSNLMLALAGIAAESLGSLRSVRINAAAETGPFLESVLTFFQLLPRNSVKSIHLSGFRQISAVCRILESQSESLEDVKVDYFVSGHETQLSLDCMLPKLPALKSLVFDVADVVEVPASLFLSHILAPIVSKSRVSRLYLPHIQIVGLHDEIRQVTDTLKKFVHATQFVLRFRRMPLSITEIVALREQFARLPAVCVSDHFIVAMDSWAEWWPRLAEVWDHPSAITGFSVFREQIDFEALGTSAQAEWLRLTDNQRSFWSSVIASNVKALFLSTVPEADRLRAVLLPRSASM